MIFNNKAPSCVEILMVVGIIFGFILGCFWTALSVKDNHDIGDVVRLTNMIKSESNRLRFEMPVEDNRNIETLLLVKNRIDPRFVDKNNYQIMSPYSSNANAVNVFARKGIVTEVSLSMPPAKVVALYSKFPVNRASDIKEFRACGITITQYNVDSFGSPNNVAMACGSSKNSPATPNVVIKYAQR